jgi:hypothetical protein
MLGCEYPEILRGIIIQARGSQVSLRDVLDRITGRRSRNPYGRVRRRSESTTELATAGLEAQVEDPFPHQAQVPPDAADRALHTDTTSGTDGGVQVPFQQMPESRPPRRPAGAPPRPVAPAPSDAATQYLQVPIIEKSEVTAVLVVIDGDMKGEVFKLHTGENRLGRSESNDSVIASKWISRQHAMVIHRDRVFALVALSERNRTYLNDREVESCEMNDGDLVRMGRTTLRFRTIEGL